MLKINTSNTIEITITNPETSNFVNDATVTVIVTDSSGAEITGTWPQFLIFVSDGLYRETFAPFDLLDGEIYTVTISANTPAGLYLECKQEHKAVDSNCC